MFFTSVAADTRRLGIGLHEHMSTDVLLADEMKEKEKLYLTPNQNDIIMGK